MPDSNLSLFPHVFNPTGRVRCGGPHLRPINRAKIIAAIQIAWSRGETPVPKAIGFDVGLHPSQVCKHLKFLEQEGLVYRRRQGVLMFIEAPRS